MIQQSNENVKTQSELISKFITTIKKLKISNLLHKTILTTKITIGTKATSDAANAEDM